MLTIENRTKQLLIVAKNSGPSLYLAPGKAAVVPQAEIDGNSKIEKLVRSGALSIGKFTAPRPVEADPPAKKEKPQKR